MSLDVYLEGEPEQYECQHCGQQAIRRPELYSANITHNLNTMADVAGIYEACWRPEEIHVTKAEQLIPLLESAIAKLKAAPDNFKPFDTPSGWGTYEQFVPWLEQYLDACREYPDADIRVSR